MVQLEVEADIAQGFTIEGSYEIFDASTTTPSNIVRAGTEWGVDVKWKTDGGLNGMFSGNFKVEVVLEQFGSGELPASLQPAPLLVATVQAFPHDYTAHVSCGTNIPAGMYKIAVCLTLQNNAGIPAGMACMNEGPLVTIYA